MRSRPCDLSRTPHRAYSVWGGSLSVVPMITHLELAVLRRYIHRPDQTWLPARRQPLYGQKQDQHTHQEE
eukprot:32422-Pyramimonas_sp.AAC.1